MVGRRPSSIDVAIVASVAPRAAPFTASRPAAPAITLPVILAAPAAPLTAAPPNGIAPTTVAPIARPMLTSSWPSMSCAHSDPRKLPAAPPSAVPIKAPGTAPTPPNALPIAPPIKPPATDPTPPETTSAPTPLTMSPVLGSSLSKPEMSIPPSSAVESKPEMSIFLDSGSSNPVVSIC